MMGYCIKILASIVVIGLLVLSQFLFFVMYSPDANTAHYAVNLTQTDKPIIVKLSEGRIMSVDATYLKVKKDKREKLETTGENGSDVHTVYFFHGCPGSRLFKHPNESHIVQKLQKESGIEIRLIRFDRPGYGYSSPLPRPPSLQQFVQDFKALLKRTIPHQKEKQHRISLLGYSLGAFHALAVAADPEIQRSYSIYKLGLLSPLADIESDIGGKEKLCDLNRFTYYIWDNFGPNVFSFLFKVATQFGFITHHDSWLESTKSCLSSEEWDMFTKNEEWKAIFNDTHIEQFRMNANQVFDDLLISHDLKYLRSLYEPIKNSGIPIEIIHQKGDRNCGIGMSRNLQNEFGSKQCILHEKEGTGHFMTFDMYFEDSLRSVLPFDKNVVQEKSPSESKRVIVIGGGLAGLSATIEAIDNGADMVYLLEKEPKLGGNSAKASSGINGIFTKAQIRSGIKDSTESFMQDTMKSGQGKSNEELVETLIKQSTSAIEFLENNGVNLDVLSKCGGHSFPRTHRAKTIESSARVTNVGWDIMNSIEQTLRTNAKYANKVRIMTSSKVTSIITSEGKKKTIGIRYQGLAGADTDKQGELYAPSIILTSGGFGANRQMLEKYLPPEKANLPTTNGPFSTGDGINVLKNDVPSAEVIDMEEVQIHPTCFVNPSDPHAKTLFLLAEAVRAHGGILINQDGNRFVNELGRRDEVSEAIFKNCTTKNKDIVSFVLLNEQGAKAFGEKLLSFYKMKGFVTLNNNLSEFAMKQNVPFEHLKKMVHSYNAAAAQQKAKDEFGKTEFPTTFDLSQPIYSMRIVPCLHYTMGGVAIDKHAQVISNEGKPISGLYAAGEVTGGVHGKNRLAGNSLLECVVFGRIAGRESVLFQSA